MPQYNHIIEAEEINTLARPCTIDEDAAIRYIEESEMQDIKPIIGDALFYDIIEHKDKYDTLLNGGIYESNDYKYIFSGLKVALAYYAWARMVKNSVNHLTRFGFVSKNDDNSSSVSWQERQAAYNDAYAVADGYMKECLEYLKAQKMLDNGKDVVQINKKRTFFNVIGQ